MSILAWIIFGALAGWIASLITGDDASHGIFGNILIGIVGAFIGGLLANFVGAGGVNGFNLYSMIVAVVGAVIVLLVFNRRRV